MHMYLTFYAVRMHGCVHALDEVGAHARLSLALTVKPCHELVATRLASCYACRQFFILKTHLQRRTHRVLRRVTAIGKDRVLITGACSNWWFNSDRRERGPFKAGAARATIKHKWP